MALINETLLLIRDKGKGCCPLQSLPLKMTFQWEQLIMPSVEIKTNQWTCFYLPAPNEVFWNA